MNDYLINFTLLLNRFIKNLSIIYIQTKIITIKYDKGSKKDKSVMSIKINSIFIFTMLNFEL